MNTCHVVAVVRYPELSPAKYCSNYFFRISCAEVKDYEQFKNDALVAISTKETLRNKILYDIYVYLCYYVKMWCICQYMSLHIHFNNPSIRTITVSM